MDVKSFFLHGELDEEIYMEQPLGYVWDSSQIFRLNKYFYVLKEAPRAFYANMEPFLHA